MPIYVFCPNCNTEYSTKHKSCLKCGTSRAKATTFRVKVEHKGKIVKKKLTGINLAIAKQIEYKLKTELIEDKYIDRDKSITLDDFMNTIYFPTEKHNKKPYSFNREEQLYRDHIKPLIGHKLISQVTKTDLEKIKTNMFKKDLSSRTIEYALHVIRHAFNIAIQTRYFNGTNPIKFVKLPKKDNRRVRWLTTEEADKLLSELKKHSQDTCEIAFLSLHTGMRFGEIANLTWQDIDLERGLIYIKDPKSKENRVAYMTDEAKSMLTERKKHSKTSLVFPSRTGGVREKPPKTFSRVVKKLGFNDGVEDPRDKVVFHTLRHTFASWLVMNSTPLYTVKELLGHKTLAMTERYSHLAPDSKRQAVLETFKANRNTPES